MPKVIVLHNERAEFSRAWKNHMFQTGGQGRYFTNWVKRAENR